MNDDLFNLIERLANLLRQETRFAGQSLGLQPIQQEALYYLSTCNKYSDTTLAVTEYLGLTKGTVSQSLKILESKALIVRQKDTNDKRITHLKVTEEGKRFLSTTCPPRKFIGSVNELTDEQQNETATLLSEILRNYQKSTGRTAFGVCKNCKFNQKMPESFLCALTKETLTVEDTRLICREFA
jgi:DNA-binding MarR family transcriptional regulator